MKITNKGIKETPNGISVELLIEREAGKYNNLTQTIEFQDFEIKDFTQDQIFTKAWQKVKPLALQVFNRVWECKVDEDSEEGAISPNEEIENPVGFELVELPTPPQPIEVPATEIFRPQVSENEKAIDLMKHLMQSDEFLALAGILPREETK